MTPIGLPNALAPNIRFQALCLAFLLAGSAESAPVQVGSPYCFPAIPNASGNPGRLGITGSSDLFTNGNRLTLNAVSLPANTFGVFIVSRTADFVPGAGGSRGNLCLGQPLGRYTEPSQILATGPNGQYTLEIDLARTPDGSIFSQVVDGDRWHFQSWFRDVLPSGTGTSNFTNAVRVDFIDSSPSLAAGLFFEEANSGGTATALRLTTMQFGRLVDLFGRDAAGMPVPVGSDFLVGQQLQTSVDYTVEESATSGRTRLTIERNLESSQGVQEFILLAEQAASTTSAIAVRDLGDAGNFTMVPRNAAVALVLDDLLDASTINGQTIQLWTGDPPATPFEARVFPSRYFGGTDVGGVRRPTRVIYDLSVTEIEALSSSTPLATNEFGVPPSLNASSPNLQWRIPTRLATAQGVNQLLTNLSGNPLATASNGPVDFGSPDQPVTRAARSGGAATSIGDPYNGFLRDETSPRVTGTTEVNLLAPPAQTTSAGFSGTSFRLPRIQFRSAACAFAPRAGDLIRQPGVVAEVLTPGTTPDTNGVVKDIDVRLVVYPPSWPSPATWEISGGGQASFETAFEPAIDAAKSACFVNVSPVPSGNPTSPATGISTDSIFGIRLNEGAARDATSAFSALTLSRQSTPAGSGVVTSGLVAGTLVPSAGGREVSFVPQLPLFHRLGQAELYFLRLADASQDPTPLTDLAGNPVLPFPEVAFAVDPSDSEQFTGGRVHRFESRDEYPPVGSEFAGQAFIDTIKQVMRPRPVVRSQANIDNSQPIMQQMTFLPGGLGVITPHTPFGSKLQHIWRYADCSFALLDPLDHNVDVEGLAWAPNGGTIQPDAFDQFEIRLAHSRWTPDEDINPSNAWPRFPFSGLDDIYLNNIVASVPSDLPAQVTVHDRSLGYNLDPGDLETASTGTTFMPFPLNRDVPQEQRRYFTWRDCDNRARGGGGNAPVDPRAYWIALGIDPGTQPVVYSPGQVQTVGLPLLMEYRVFPDATAIGINGWDFNIAVNSSSRPYFRSFSSGGINQGGTTETVNPDQESTASGGFAPGSNPPGAITPGQDNVVHLGAIDFITRVSHSNSIWFAADIEGQTSSTPFVGRDFQAPIIEPSTADQPQGTEVTLRFRGASSITYDDSGTPGIDNDALPINPDQLADFQVDAFTLDVYGDYYNDFDFPVSHNGNRDNPGISFVGGSDLWRDTVDEIRDARFYQLRLTFIGNPATGQSAEVSALALTWLAP